MPQQPPKPQKLEDRFVENVSRYPFYLVTVLLGGVWVLIKPFVDLYKKSPLYAALVGIAALIGLFVIHFTLRGMAGDTFFPEWLIPQV